MKATKLLLASAIFAGLTALSFAGPGPQLWSTQEKIQQVNKAPAAVDVAQTCATCSCCAKKV